MSSPLYTTLPGVKEDPQPAQPPLHPDTTVFAAFSDSTNIGNYELGTSCSLTMGLGDIYLESSLKTDTPVTPLPCLLVDPALSGEQLNPQVHIQLLFSPTQMGSRLGAKYQRPASAHHPRASSCAVNILRHGPVSCHLDEVWIPLGIHLLVYLTTSRPATQISRVINRFAAMQDTLLLEKSFIHCRPLPPPLSPERVSPLSSSTPRPSLALVICVQTSPVPRLVSQSLVVPPSGHENSPLQGLRDRPLDPHVDEAHHLRA
ncbi:hypothetical protein R3P38DRAFT_3231103 [Favolaschia claudopus]|uniref:Uncharacterized protein n=1 Tax=Favolaschia claudopus TaxID=2862362 RepID=A0AAV9ZM10_9AGAR